MARSSSPRWLRRVRSLAVVAAVVGVLAAVRARLLGQEQQRFEAKYGPRS